MTLEVVDTIAGLRARLGTAPLDAERPLERPPAPGVGPLERPRAVVMTMGALHQGHRELIRAARAWLGNRGLGPRDADLVVTLFVNPLQFNNRDDLRRYPRTLDDDLAACRAEGVDVVFAPSAEEMYPDGDPVVTVDPGALGDTLEGAGRPGHFRGVLTVVNRLLMLTRPDAAVFGEKDYQQLLLVRRMVADLLIPVDVLAVPTIREDDGLALSSRNRRLGRAAREQARAVPQSLERLAAAVAEGVDPREAAAECAEWLAAAPGVDSVDYVAVTSPDLGPVPAVGEARGLVAAVVDGIRLIDNTRLMIPRSR